MGWMPTDPKTQHAMGLLTAEEALTGSIQSHKEDAAIWGSGATERELKRQGYRSAEKMAGERNKSEERRAQIQADAIVQAARARKGYNKGGPVVDVGYKHSNNPMYAKYGSSMDSSLLAKGRR